MSAPTFVAILYAGLEDYGTLTIDFDGHTLQCLDDSSQYESYYIVEDGRRIIV
jgi:hypothetical protein